MVSASGLLSLARTAALLRVFDGYNELHAYLRFSCKISCVSRVSTYSGSTHRAARRMEVEGKQHPILGGDIKSGTCLQVCFHPHWVCSGRASWWQKVYAEAFSEQRYPQHGLHYAHLGVQELRIFRLWLLYQLRRKPTSLFAHRPMSFIRFQPYPSKPVSYTHL